MAIETIRLGHILLLYNQNQSQIEQCLNEGERDTLQKEADFLLNIFEQATRYNAAVRLYNGSYGKED